MAEKKQSQKAIEDCVEHIAQHASGIDKDMLMRVVMEPIRGNFEKYLDTPAPEDGEVLWRSHRRRMRENSRYLGTLAEFFALKDGAIAERHLRGAFELVKYQCTVGKADDLRAQYIYCNGGGGKAKALGELGEMIAALLKP